MKKLIIKISFSLLMSLSAISLAQNSIAINGERILVKEFLTNTNSPLSKMEYSVGDDFYRSPFFGQQNAIKLDGNTFCEMMYSRLGYRCPQAGKGFYAVDYKTPAEFLPLFKTAKYEKSWDDPIFDFFSNHSDGIDDNFMKLWNSPEYETNEKKKILLNKLDNKAVKEKFYRMFIDEESVAYYSQKIEKEKKLNVEIGAQVDIALDEYLKIVSVTQETSNKIKADVKASILKNTENSNFIEIKYYRVKLNGTFLDMVKEYAKLICDKNDRKEKLIGFEEKFYKKYMALDKVFLISNMQYLSYKIDKSKIGTTIKSIVADIEASVNSYQLKAVDARLAFNISSKVTTNLNSEFKAEGGYILQIAESGQLAKIDKDCSDIE